MSSTPTALCSASCSTLTCSFFICAPLPLSSPYLIFYHTLPFPFFFPRCSGLHIHIDICCIYANQLPCDCSSLSGIPTQLAHSNTCFLSGWICLA